MKKEYDFSRGKRGPVVRPSSGKVRITIRLDRDIVAWFRARVEKHGGGNYQTMMNDALRSFIEHEDDALEDVLRRVLREELAATK